MNDSEGFLGEDDDALWPDVPRLCFGPGDDQRLNANIAWVQSRRNLFAYAEGYRRAALALQSSMSREKENPDFIVWPLAFLWRHYIELMLKDIIAKGRLIDGDGSTFPEHHRLMDLWREARRHIQPLGPDDSPELANVEVALRELEKIDPGGIGFRYPVARGQVARSLPEAPDTINLGSLQTTMVGLSNFFDACRDMMSSHLDALNEMGAEYR